MLEVSLSVDAGSLYFGSSCSFLPLAPGMAFRRPLSQVTSIALRCWRPVQQQSPREGTVPAGLVLTLRGPAESREVLGGGDQLLTLEPERITDGVRFSAEGELFARPVS